MNFQDEIVYENDKLNLFQLLFEKYYKPLTIQAFYYLEDMMEAEDLVQNLFITIWEKQAHIHIQTSFKTYLQVSVKNRCYTILKKRKINLRKEEKYKSTGLV